MKRSIEIKVRGYHLDMFGHVNNARYLEFIEEGRWEFFENEPGFMNFITTNNLTFPIVNINIDYRSSAELNDILIIETCIKKIGNKSAKLDQKIYIKNKEKLAINAEVTFVFIDNTTAKTVEIPEKLKKSWQSIIESE